MAPILKQQLKNINSSLFARFAMHTRRRTHRKDISPRRGQVTWLVTQLDVWQRIAVSDALEAHALADAPVHTLALRPEADARRA